jgi:pyrimidine-specific ribonucleoside hydrolase
MRALFLMLMAGGLACASVPVWIDTDPSVAPGGHEVDDGFALIQAFHSRALKVRGVSVVFGNAPLSEAFPIAQRLVRDFGPPGLNVASGAASANDLGIETDASRALAAALRRERMVILMLGPATNVATLLRNHPELRNRIEKIIAVAGRRPNQRFSPSPGAPAFRDFNFELDPPGFQVLLDARVPLVLAPWEISSRVWMRAVDLVALRASDASLAWVLDAASDWLAYWKNNLGAEGFNPFDTLAVGYAISPQGFRCDRLHAGIELRADDTVTAPGAQLKPYLLVDHSMASHHSALYCSEAPPSFHETLLKLLAKHE